MPRASRASAAARTTESTVPSRGSATAAYAESAARVNAAARSVTSIRWVTKKPPKMLTAAKAAATAPAPLEIQTEPVAASPASAAWVTTVTGSGANPAKAADFTDGVLPSGTLAFAADARLGPQFANGAFVGLHGSWNRQPLSGYKVVFVPFGTNGFPLHEALILELAGRFHAGTERGRLATYYLTEALYAYLHLGATAKASALLSEHPEHLRAETRALQGLNRSELITHGTTSSTSSLHTTDERLDVNSVLRASEVISFTIGCVIFRSTDTA